MLLLTAGAAFVTVWLSVKQIDKCLLFVKIEAEIHNVQNQGRLKTMLCL